MKRRPLLAFAALAVLALLMVGTNAVWCAAQDTPPWVGHGHTAHPCE